MVSTRMYQRECSVKKLHSRIEEWTRTVRELRAWRAMIVSVLSLTETGFLDYSGSPITRLQELLIHCCDLHLVPLHCRDFRSCAPHYRRSAMCPHALPLQVGTCETWTCTPVSTIVVPKRPLLILLFMGSEEQDVTQPTPLVAVLTMTCRPVGAPNPPSMYGVSYRIIGLNLGLVPWRGL
jgi:hypothetical protein